MVIRIVGWYFILLTVISVALFGHVMHRALGATFDPFVQRLETLFHVSPGQMIPVDMQAPDVRLQYMGTHSVGNGNYDIRVHRVR